MRSTFKKSMAILLAVILAFSVLTVGVVGASAAGEGMEVTVSSNVPTFFPTSTQTVDSSANTVTVTYWFNFHEYMMVNNQWALTYDPNVLQYNTDDGVNQTVTNNKTTYLVYKFPDNELGSMEFNPSCETAGVMKGNITKAEGFDCYGEGKLPFLSITFDIIDSTAISTEIHLDLQVLQVRHMNADVSTAPVDFINHSEIVNDDVQFTADESYTAAYEGEYNPDYSVEPVLIPTKFKVDAVNLSLGSSIAIQAKVAPDKVADYDSFWVEFTAPGKDTERIDPQSNHLDAKGRYVFAFTKIYANEMYKDVTMVLHAMKNGVEYYGMPHTISIKSYAYADLNGSSAISDKYRTLLADLLNYGAQAQIYTNSTVALVNADLTDTQRAAATADAACTYKNGTVARIDNPTVSWQAARCVLGATIQPKMTVKDTTGSNMAGMKVRAVMNGKTYTIDEFESIGDNKFTFVFDQVFANQLDKQILFTVVNADGTAVSNTYAFDVESYASTFTTASGDKDMIDAMVKYGRGAKAYAS